MKTYYFSFFFLSFLIVMTLAIITLPLVSSEDAPKYNFGTMQADKSFSIVPGESVTSKLYFYNVYGNRATHIKLNVSQVPKDWKIEIIPALTNKEYDVSGIKTTVQENLVVQVSNASQIKGQDTDKINYISSQVGWIGANFVTIKITAPSNAELGKTSNIQVNAVAFWLGQGGSVALQQERSFDYTATTVSETYYEEPIETSTSSLTRKVSSIFSQTQIKPIYAVTIGITIILVIVLIILFVLMNKKRKKENQVNQVRKKGKNKREKGV